MDQLRVVKSFGEIVGYIESNGIKGVFLDLDNTLYEYAPCHEFALHCCFDRLGSEFYLSFDAFHQLYRDCGQETKKYNKGLAASHSRLLYFQKMAEILSGQNGVALALELEDLYWKNFFIKIVLRDGAADFLGQLRDFGVTVIIVSDLTARIQLQKLLYLKIDGYLSAIVTSEEAGAEKPDDKIYRLALQKSGLAKNQIIAVGDDEAKDGGGGINFGIATFLLEV